MYADKARKKEYVPNTLTSTNNDIELFFLAKGEKNLVCSYIQTKCVLTLHKKSSDWEINYQGNLIFKKHDLLVAIWLTFPPVHVIRYSIMYYLDKICKHIKKYISDKTGGKFACDSTPADQPSALLLSLFFYGRRSK